MSSLVESLLQLFQEQPIGQSIGLFALMIGLSGFAQQKDHRLKIILSIYGILMGVHFLMMGSYPGAISAWIGSARSWIASRTHSWKWMLVFMTVLLLLTVPKITSWILVLPLIGSLIGTWAMFREAGMRLRLMMLAGTLFWLIHNIALGSIGGTLIESSFLIMNALTIYRLWRAQEFATSSKGICQGTSE